MLVKYVLHAFKTRIIVIYCDITVETCGSKTHTLVVLAFCRLEKLWNPNLKFKNKEIFYFWINVLIKWLQVLRCVFVGNIAGSSLSSQVKSFWSALCGSEIPYLRTWVMLIFFYFLVWIKRILNQKINLNKRIIYIFPQKLLKSYNLLY